MTNIEKLVEFRKFIINATQKDIEEHLEGYLRAYLDPVIDDLTFDVRNPKITDGNAKLHNHKNN